MKIVVVSDTHNRHQALTYPEADVLIHCGDFTSLGTLEEIGNFARWIEFLPYKHKLVIAGNHDRHFASKPEAARKMLAELAPSVTYLQDTAVVIEGLKFYGSPWTPEFSGKWVFHKQAGEEMAWVWEQIPDDVDVLITHGPAFGCLDHTGDHYGNMHAGCEALAKRLPELTKLKLHAFGHIHEGYGMTTRTNALGGYYTAVNAAACTIAYNPENQPIEVDLDESIEPFGL